MSLSRGKFGIEYNPRQMKPDSSGLGWVFALVALVAGISLTWTLVKRVRTNAEETRLAEAEAERVTADENRTAAAPPPPSPATALTFQAFQPLNASYARRPPKVRNLLMRLEEAEKRCDVEMAVTTIEAIRSLPGAPAADLDDSLARRLGALNVQRLFDLRNAQWVKSVEVSRGSSASRIAAENGSTLASLTRLNGGSGKIAKIVAGQRLYVMNHPRFNLVLHRRTLTADLLLNGKFFRRYDLVEPVKAREGAYEMPEKRRVFWNAIGRSFDAEARAELDMLLPNGTPILVSEL